MGAGCLTASNGPAPTTPIGEEEDPLVDYERNLDGIIAEVNDPGVVQVGDTFTFGARIQNTQNKERILRSIDIERTFLAGFDITDINLERTDEYTVDSINEDIYEFNTAIKANGSLDVTFTATATKAGEYGGDLDICIDNDINCVFGSIDVVIQ
jgi:hypothetical protein